MTDPRAKPFAEAREDREKIVARLRGEAAIGDRPYGGLMRKAADLIDHQGKQLAEAARLLRQPTLDAETGWLEAPRDWLARRDAFIGEDTA